MKLPLLPLIGFLLLQTVHAAEPARAPRIAVLRFYHETPTFLADETKREDFIYPGSPAKGEALLGSDPRNELGGFVKVAREYGAELVGIESPGAPKTGTGSGWVTRDAYEHFAGRMIEQLRAEGPFDGVYLCVHGAMAVRGVPRPEAELARRVREVVGDKAILAGTFDPHGNEDDAFLKHADLAFAYKYYPHYDTHLQGERAARMMIRSIRGDFRPTHAVRKVPILTATVFQWTGQHPWSTLVQRCLTWEAREPDVYVNFFYGFPWSDVPDLGMCFQVITNNDPTLAERVADDLKETAWRMREEMFSATPLHTVGEAMDLLDEAVKNGKVPAVLADYSDRSGNATWILADVIRRNVARCLVATVRDDRVLQSLAKSNAKAGDTFDMDVGGYMDESAGKPVRVTGSLHFFKPSSPSGNGRAHVRFGKDSVLVISQNLVQVTEPKVFATWGLKVDDFDVYAIKSRVHFRRGFDDDGFAKTILLVEPPGPFMGTSKLDALRYDNIRVKDFYPFGKDISPQ